MDELIENLNPEEIVVDTSNIINKNDCSIEIEELTSILIQVDQNY